MDSLIAWVGGKKRLRSEIISRFPAEFDRYIEVFGGAAWVLFAHDRHAPLEVYNDLDGELVNLFRCAKYHHDELAREAAGCLNSREMFNDIRANTDAPGTTDIQRAAQFYLRLRMSYAADARTFGCGTANLYAGLERLPEVSKRLQRVVIEHKDFEALIKQYDRPNALLYCDPPYHKTEKHYAAQFTADDHRRLNCALRAVKGRFILSYNDDEFVRELYKDFSVSEVSRALGLSHKNQARREPYKELIITNY